MAIVFDTPFVQVEDNTAISSNGDVIKCFNLELIESFTYGEQNYDALFDIFYKAFKSLSKGIAIVKQDVCLKNKFDTSDFPEITFLQRNDKKYFHGKEYMKHESRIFFVYSGSKSVLKNVNIKNPFKKLPSVEEVKKDLNEIHEVFFREVQQTIEFINGSKTVKLSPMSEADIRDYTRCYFNGFYNDRNTDAQKTSKHYQIGDKLIGGYVVRSLKQLPQTLSNTVVDPIMSSTDYKFYKGFADGLNLDLPFDHIYTQVIWMDNHREIKKDIEKTQGILHGARAFSPSNKTAAEEIAKYVSEISRDETVKFIRGHFNVMFFAKDENDYKICDNELSKAFKNMDIVPYVPIGNNLANIYNNSFFGFLSNLDKDSVFTLDLQQAICMLSNTTNYKNDEEGIYFNDRINNLPIRKDVWDKKKKRLKARNFFIMSPTGNGKSVLYANISRQFYEQDIIQVINDLGDSYQKLCHLFPKEHTLYIKYKEGSPLGINPLYIMEGETLGTTQLNQILGFISLLWKRNESLKIEEEVSLRKVIQCYYENVETNHSFPLFYEFVYGNKDVLMEKLEIEYQHFHIEDFLHNCSEFVGTGTYAFLFKLKENFSYDISGKKLVVFEFDEAKEDPLLLSVLLLISSEVTRRLCWLDKSKRGVVFFDEFAKFLKFPNILNAVQYYFQAARKQECAIGIVLQTPTQLPHNDTATSIIENVQVIYVLENTKGYQPIVDRFKMSSHAHNQMMSIKSNFGGKVKYSELYLQLENEGNVVRLHLPEDNLLAYQTEGADNAIIMSIFDECGDMEQAINHFKTIKK